MKARRRNPRHGVSLMETLLALAVMALVSLIIASGLGTSARVLNRSSAIGAQIDHAINRLQLRGWMERASSSPFPGMRLTGFSGTSSQLVFEALPEDDIFWPGAPIVATVSAGADGRIVVSVVGYSALDKGQNLTIDLSQPGVGIEINYFGQASPEALPEWQDSWRAEFGLPQLVKLSSQSESADFPPMVIKPAKVFVQREMSLSSLLPPMRPSRP